MREKERKETLSLSRFRLGDFGVLLKVRSSWILGHPLTCSRVPKKTSGAEEGTAVLYYSLVSTNNDMGCRLSKSTSNNQIHQQQPVSSQQNLHNQPSQASTGKTNGQTVPASREPATLPLVERTSPQISRYFSSQRHE